MLFALGSPVALVLLAVGFVVACAVQVGVRRLIDRPGAARWSGNGSGTGSGGRHGSGVGRSPGWGGRPSTSWGRSSGAGSAWRSRLRLQAVLDVFGVVAVLLGGVGWAALPTPERSRTPRRRLVLALLLGCLVDVVIGAALIFAWVRAAGEGSGVLLGTRQVLGDLVLQHGLDAGLSVGGPASALGSGALLLIGAEFCAVGLLGLVPLPPLPAGHVLLAYAPTTTGWQKARYYLVEQQIGVAVLVALAVFPLAQGQPLLVFLVDLLFRVLIAPLVGA